MFSLKQKISPQPFKRYLRAVEPQAVSESRNHKNVEAVKRAKIALQCRNPILRSPKLPLMERPNEAAIKRLLFVTPSDSNVAPSATPGSFALLSGPSGCGKTALINKLCAGQDRILRYNAREMPSDAQLPNCIASAFGFDDINDKHPETGRESQSVVAHC